MLGLERDRGRDGEERSRITRALPAVTVVERRAVDPVPRDDERLDRFLHLRSHVEKRRALRRAQPLVAVTGVDVGVERARGRARSGRAHERRRRSRSHLPRGPPRRRPSRSLTRPVDHSMCEQKTTRVSRRARARRTDERTSVAPVRSATWRQRISMPPYSASPSSTSSPGRERERADDRVQGRARVRREREVVGALRRRRRRARGAPSSSSAGNRRSRREELDRLALELALEALVRLEDGARAGAERPVVQVDDRRIEEEKFLHSP